VVATLEDIEMANRLMMGALATRLDAMLPQTCQLLVELNEYVTRRAKQEGLSPSAIRFTQRQLRETLHWSDRPLRRQPARLVELEYVLVYRTGRGNQRAYQLAIDPKAPASSVMLAGLIDVATLRKKTQR
jgi:DNA primase